MNDLFENINNKLKDGNFNSEIALNKNLEYKNEFDDEDKKRNLMILTDVSNLDREFDEILNKILNKMLDIQKMLEEKNDPNLRKYLTEMKNKYNKFKTKKR